MVILGGSPKVEMPMSTGLALLPEAVVGTPPGAAGDHLTSEGSMNGSVKM